MALIKKLVVQWTGLTALPGVSVHYALSSSTNPSTDLANFFNGIKTLFPNTLSWQIPSAGDTLNDDDGHISGPGWTSAGGGVVAGTGGSVTYAAGTGAKVVWLTPGITNKFRRVRGHTNLLPISTTFYTTSGVITSAGQSTILTAANALVATGSFGIWHRNTPGSSNGFISVINSALVPNTVISLRSRRY